MSRKLVISVILLLQMTASLCDLPQPEQELVDKFHNVKDSLYKSLAPYFSTITEFITPLIEHVLYSEVWQDFVEKLSEVPHMQRVEKFTRDMAGKVFSLLNKTSWDALGLYGEHVRPWAGPYVDQAITAIKGFLDSAQPGQPGA